MLIAIVALLIGYLLGSIPTGYWVAKAVAGIDIREHGSRSTGATNVLRCVGKLPALFVFLFDIGKGSAAVWICNSLEAQGLMTGMPFPELKLVPMVVALITLVGHSKSIFLNFQGGKSAATALGLAIAMNPLAAGESFLTWLAVLAVSRFVSLASIVAVISSGGWMMLNHAPIGYTAYCMLGAVYVVARHRANINRLLTGTEPRIGQKAKQPPETSEQSEQKV
jgi:glycerol-3-phosphate acyltransferase PlsY